MILCSKWLTKHYLEARLYCSVRCKCIALGRKDRIMLVLTRKINESIIINDEVSVVVVEVRGDRVRLGIEAPKDVSVHRKEVYEEINGTATPKKLERCRLAIK